jgi:hypothetical protein
LAFGACQWLGAREAQQFGYIVAMTVLGSWIVLITSKATESRDVDTSTRQLLNVALGALLGGAGLVLAPWLGLTPGGSLPNRLFVTFDSLGAVEAHSAPLRFLAYFGLLSLANGGWNALTVRDRSSRFRLWPLAKSALIALVLYPVWPFAEPFNVATATSIAIVTQLVSPWSEAASAYARARERRRWV